MSDEIFHHGIRYRNYRKQYKYKLTKDYSLEVGIKPAEAVDACDAPGDRRHVKLETTGNLTTFERYEWDGPSGPAPDFRCFMRGSLVHDALYQLMRLGKISDKKHRKRADQLLRDICIDDGMWRWVAWGVYGVERAVGWWFARPRSD